MTDAFSWLDRLRDAVAERYRTPRLAGLNANCCSSANAAGTRCRIMAATPASPDQHQSLPACAASHATSAFIHVAAGVCVGMRQQPALQRFRHDAVLPSVRSPERFYQRILMCNKTDRPLPYRAAYRTSTAIIAKSIGYLHTR